MIRAFYELDSIESAYKPYADVLSEHTKFLMTEAASYIASLYPQKRLSEVKCVAEDSGGQFPIRTYACTFTQDKTEELGEGGLSNSSSNDDSWRAKATALHQARSKQLNDFQKDAISKFYSPLRQVAFEWFKTSEIIKEGVVKPEPELRFAALYPPIK